MPSVSMPRRPVNGKVLKAAGLIGRVRDGVRLLAKGELKTKLNITVVGASKAAIDAVEKAGGTVVVKAPRSPRLKAPQRKLRPLKSNQAPDAMRGPDP